MMTDFADTMPVSPKGCMSRKRRMSRKRGMSRKALLAAALTSILLAGCATNQHPQGWDSGSSSQPTAAAKPGNKTSTKRKAGPVSGTQDPTSDQASSAKPVGKKRLGDATFYASYFEGRLTASGEPYDSQAMTAAHKTLPFGTRVKVTALDSGETTVVRINDRGPFVDGRIIDLSRKAAEQLGMVQDGAAPVQLQVLEQ